MKYLNKDLKLKKHIVVLILLMTFALSCNTNNKTQDYVAIEAPVLFSPNIPVDVDPELQKILKDAGDIYQLNEVFNLYSWQALVAINWPLDSIGNPQPSFTDVGDPTWNTWKEAFQVYRKDGKTPAGWDSPRSATGLGLDASVIADNDSRIVLSSTSATNMTNINIADETDQAFAGELFDQNGNVVVYEVLMNKAEFDYVVTNKLYNINGQLAFTQSNVNADFPKGDYSSNTVGATEIKFAWKILTDSDIEDRYYTDQGYIIDESTGDLEQVDLGLIGMHISQKTPTGKQWVWSTFEHIDNLDQNTTEINGKTVVIHPTLTDPNCEICPVNVDATAKNSTYTFNKGTHGDYWLISGDDSKYFANSSVMKTQSKRMIDIPVRVENINSKMQDYFKSIGSVWQYYQLIDTQYPLDQNAPPAISTATEYHLPESVVNKPGGNPNMIFLTNISMETFFQKGNQIAGLMENSQSDITIFGTESCMGCHSSAYMNIGYDVSKDSLIQGNQLSGDFSWLLKKASWEQGKPKSANNP
ncbi:hypothetical protein [Psychroserpens sp.]|uniref:hypothetical protein n=1 Tax=Psychroserpens sp. TaxID=2020870 RepID=UPI001B13B7F5|nr:hypothetical protein [Psychroserpens sp.]MBO6606401.1 hypothetical protein [Psychroserpens sp.]MBO6632130.1 hypothetical protein [Psychroserpens sp.]MBO6653105.1 hypothetical protein [Psychroserpens sp.]MBO6680867.1 hypothetical protein [Psychroserpens sp.]MBO6750175.1 hypothetical protein [Psychroserpens sp.]